MCEAPCVEAGHWELEAKDKTIGGGDAPCLWRQVFLGHKDFCLGSTGAWLQG